VYQSTRSGRRWLIGVAAASALVTALAGCSSGTGTSNTSSSPKNFTFLGVNENTTIAAVLTSLSKNECAPENKALPLKLNKQAQATLDQQLQLLAGQKALPVAFASPNSPALTEKLFKAGDIVDFDSSAASDIAKDIVPAAKSTVGALYKGKTIVLPTELNIEGIWYNKSILEKNNISVPSSWSQLVDAFGTLKAAGVQPISNAGKGGDGWGVTRWVGAYLFRELGPDALSKVADGSAKLTDPDYVKAADAIAALGKAGDFGPSPTSIDYATALNTFLTGKAGFIYMGSWAVSDFNKPDENKIGADNIGFMPFPDVAGGQGSADQTPANAGLTVAISASAYKGSSKVRDWVKCIADNYGTVALQDHGQVTGFTVAGDVKVSALTKLVQDQIAKTKTSVQWFEALFPAAATTASQNNGGLLGSGQSTGEQFMQTVSAGLANG
jgi:raffinose/stachyose/melibiose transport system substrate-binding protein